MPLKSNRRRLEVPLSEGEFEALREYSQTYTSMAAAVREVLAQAIPKFAQADPLPERGKYTRKTK